MVSADKAEGEPFIYLLNEDISVHNLVPLKQIGLQSTK